MMASWLVVFAKVMETLGYQWKQAVDAQACEHRVICFRMVSSSRVWWHHRPVIPATGEWLPVMLVVTKATEGKKRSCLFLKPGLTVDLGM